MRWLQLSEFSSVVCTKNSGCDLVIIGDHLLKCSPLAYKCYTIIKYDKRSSNYFYDNNSHLGLDDDMSWILLSIQTLENSSGSFSPIKVVLL